MSSFLRGPSLGRELVKMRSLEGDGDRSEGTLTGSGQATLSALLHAGSETAEINPRDSRGSGNALVDRKMEQR